MLNQELSDSLKRDGQAKIDASSSRNAAAGGSSSGAGGGSSSSSGGRSSAAPSIGMLAGTMNSTMDRHNAAALGAAGFQYLEGIGVKQDRDRGLALMADAGNMGDAISMHILAVTYYNGSHSVAADHARAYPWFVKDAATGDVDALCTACAMAVQGDGPPVQKADGERFCLAVLAKGNASAADNLGFLYFGGVPSVKPDRVKTAVYFHKASGIGCAGAVFVMSRLDGCDWLPYPCALEVANWKYRSHRFRTGPAPSSATICRRPVID